MVDWWIEVFVANGSGATRQVASAALGKKLNKVVATMRKVSACARKYGKSVVELELVDQRV